MLIRDGERDIQRFWSSTCGQGSFKGKTAVVLELFRRQIPEYDTVAGNAFNSF